MTAVKSFLKVPVGVFLVVGGRGGETEITCGDRCLKDLYSIQFGESVLFKNPKPANQMGCLVQARAGIST